MLSLDTETTGLDFWHGTRPFIVTTCRDDGTQVIYEWGVDPLTRQPVVPPSDLTDIRNTLARIASWGKCSDPEVRERHVLVGHNIKFDSHALAQLGLEVPWGQVRDTIVADHLLASSAPHNLTDCALRWLGVDIRPYEASVEEATQKCRRMVQQARLAVKRGKEGDHPLAAWRIAEEGLPEMPSVKGDKWHADMWLPRAMVKYLWETSQAGATWAAGGTPEELKDQEGWEFRPPELGGQHHWWTVTRDYANADSAVTVALWKVMRAEIERRGLWKIYLESMRLQPVAFDMERRGLTYVKSNAEELKQKFRDEVEANGRLCVNLARSYGHDLVLPKGASPNDNLRQFCFQVMDLPRFYGKKSKTAAPTLDKAAMAEYLTVLPPRSRQLRFVEALLDKRKRDTALGFLAAYDRFLLPLAGDGGGEMNNWGILRPSLNVTGTDTLRMSSSNPNGQQVSKQEEECQLCDGDDPDCRKCDGTGVTRKSLRYCFGPAPGRTWYCLDYENIELRIPGYESGERAMVELFEKPDEAPYFGSYHLLNCSLIYPDLFWPLADKKGAFKKRYGATWYQWGKNFGFAFSYGGGRRTCDAAAHRAGSYDLVVDNLKEHAKLNHKYITYANKHGYVETLPDRTVDPARGYPILCSRDERGGVSPTVPLNYHVSGSAMWCTRKAMPRVHSYLAEQTRLDPRGYYLVLQVHDEMIFDFPAERIAGEHLPKVRELKWLMELSGDEIGIPLKVAASHHVSNWGEGKSCA